MFHFGIELVKGKLISIQNFFNEFGCFRKIFNTLITFRSDS